MEELKKFLEEQGLEQKAVLKITKPALWASIDENIKSVLLSCLNAEVETKKKES